MSDRRKLMKGNFWWAPSYAVTSLNAHKARNIGIALILAVSISIPTTVFIWTGTASLLAVEDYFDENAYQINMHVDSAIADYTSLSEARDFALASGLVEYAHVIPSTVCILQGSWPDWYEYNMLSQRNYLDGIKDGRVILANNEILDAFSKEVEWEGRMNLAVGETVVSQNFVDTAFDVHGVNITLGSFIDIDLLRFAAKQNIKDDDWTTPDEAGRIRISGLKVVGIYRIVAVSNIGQSFLSIIRQNWNALGGGDPVLGMTDAVILLDEQIDEDVFDDVATKGYFSPVGFIRASRDGLVAAGVTQVVYNLKRLKVQIEERFPSLRVIGYTTIEELEAHIAIYLRSQVLIVLGLPIILMGLMLTVFTSETSISYRRGEISSLRAKGAAFNQIFSAVIWESIALAVLGLGAGLLMAVFMAPLMGSSNGLLSFDLSLYMLYLDNAIIPYQAVILAVAIALYLPSTYLLHVARRIDVSEIGQPSTRSEYETPEETSPWFYWSGLGLVLTILVIMPLIIAPRGPAAMLEVLAGTLLLFSASYLGSRSMRLAAAHAFGRSQRLLGEKSLYLKQSFRRRKGQFIPLMIILTLTLTTTTMTLIQTQSIETTMSRELEYAIGADMRVESYGLTPEEVSSFLGYSGVNDIASFIETSAAVNASLFFLEGVDASSYLSVGLFTTDSFVSGTPTQVLTALDSTPNGIVISEHHATRWRIEVGQTITVSVGTINSTTTQEFQVVGIMISAPGLGIASTHGFTGVPFGSYFGFQVAATGGFSLVNRDFLSSLTYIENAHLVLLDIIDYDLVTPLVTDIELVKNNHVFTPENTDLTQIPRLSPFLSGLQGLTMISYILCAAMGLFAIVLFLSSAVGERESEYAVFRALGGTKKQVAAMVFGEFAGIVLATILISFLLGLVFGLVMTSLTFGIYAISPVLPEVLALPVTVMILTVAMEATAMIVACYMPARRAGATDPASTLRNL
ncbi:MAG: FtsX-like permease family protein [Candidatus Thorarchaeota archaeon]